MLLPSKAFISTYISLVYAQPSSKILFYVFFILNLDLKLNIVLDQQLIQAEGEDSRLRETIIGKDNLLSKIIGMTNILNFSRSSNPIIIYVVVVGLLLMSAWIAGKLFIPKKISALAKHSGESERNISFSVKVLSILLHYFDYFFLFIIVMICRLLSCNPFVSQYETNLTQGRLIDSQIGLASQASVANIVTSRCSINQAIICSSINHIFLTGCSVILLLSGFLFKYYSHKLQTYRPNPSFPLSKYGSIDNVHWFIVILLQIIKTIFLNIGDNGFNKITMFYYMAVLLSFCDLVIQTISLPFFSKLTNRLRYVEMLSIFVTSIFVSFTLAFDVPLFRRQYSVLAAMCVVVLILIKTADNLEEAMDRIDILGAGKGRSQTKKVLSFVYLGMQYIDTCFIDDVRKIKTLQFQRIIFHFMCQQNKINRAGTGSDSLDFKMFAQSKTRAKNPAFAKAKLATDGGKIVRKDKDNRASSSQFERFPSNMSKTSNFFEDKSKLSLGQEDNRSAFSHNTQEHGMTRAGSEVPFDGFDRSASAFNGLQAPRRHYQPSSLPQGAASPKNKGSTKNLIGNSEREVPSARNESERALLQKKSSRQIEEPPNLVEESRRSMNQHMSERFEKLMRDAKTIGNNNTLNVEKHEAANLLNKSGNDSRYFLLDSFEESNFNNVKLPIQMIDVLLEEQVRSLANRAVTDISVLGEVLAAYVHFKCVYLGAVYQVSIKIRRLEQKFKRQARQKHADQHKFLFNMLYKYITVHIKNNLETGNLILPSLRNQMSFTTTQSNEIKMYDCIKFSNIYNDIKANIKQVCETKGKFLVNLANDGADFKDIFASSNEFTSYKLKLNAMFSTLLKKSKNKFTPLMMIYGMYQYHIEQNIFEARRVIRNYIIKRFFFDLRQIARLPINKNEEMMLISVSMETNSFHLINYASCNCYYFLEYDSHELLNKDLNQLVPKPLSDYHEQLMMPKNLTGVLFEKKGITTLSIKKKNGFLATCTAVFRMNYRISQSLEVISGITFDKDTLGKKNLLVVDEEMQITEISEISTDLFEKGSYIYQYNMKFKYIFKCLDHVSQFRLSHRDIDIDSIMTDNDILESYRVYFSFINGDDIDIVDKNGMRRSLNMRVVISYMPSVLKYLRFVEYDIYVDPRTTNEISPTPSEMNFSNAPSSARIDSQGSQITEVEFLKGNKRRPFNYTLLDSKERKIKDLLDYLQSSSLVKPLKKSISTSQMNMTTLRNVDSPVSASRSPMGEKSQTHKVMNKTISPETDDPTPSNNFVGGDDADGNPIVPYSPDALHSRMLNYNKAMQGGMSQRSGQRLDEIDEKEELANLGSSAADYAAHGNHHKERDEVESGRHRSSVQSKILRRDTKIHQYVIILMKKIESLGTNVMFMTLIFYLLSSMVFQVAIGYSKYIVQDNVATDIRERIVLLDWNADAVRSISSTLSYLNFEHLVRTNTISDNYFASQGMESVIDDKFLLLDTFLNQPQQLLQKIELAVKALYYKDKDEIKKYKQIGEKVEVMRPANSAGFTADYFETTEQSLKSVSAYLQPPINKYIYRHDSLGSPLTSEEAWLNTFLQHSLGWKFILVVYDQGKYLRNFFIHLTQSNKNEILLTQLLAIASVSLIIFIILVYAFVLRFKMKNVYRTIFYFKRGDIVKEITAWEKVKIFVGNLLLDERATLGEMSKSTLTFRLDDMNGVTSTIQSGSRISPMMLNKSRDSAEKGNQYVKFNRKIDMRLMLRNSDYSFEMYKLSAIGILIVLPLIIFHIYEYYNNLGSVSRLRNSVKLFSHVIDMRGTYRFMRESLITALAWNDTMPFAGQISSDVFKSYSTYMKQAIIPGFTDLRELDYGQQYSSFFQNASTDISLCTLIENHGTGKIRCANGSVLGIMENPFPMYLRTLTALYDDIYSQWTIERSHNLTALFDSSKYRSEFVIGMNNSFVEEIYYILMIQLSSTVKTLIDPTLPQDDAIGSMKSSTLQFNPNTTAQYFVVFCIPLSMLTAFIFYLCVYRKLLRAVFDFWHTAYLLPMDLIRKNPLLDKYFKTLEKQANSRISFF